jgi:hypothetical protein
LERLVEQLDEAVACVNSQVSGWWNTFQPGQRNLLLHRHLIGVAVYAAFSNKLNIVRAAKEVDYTLAFFPVNPGL